MPGLSRPRFRAAGNASQTSRYQRESRRNNSRTECGGTRTVGEKAQTLFSTVTNAWQTSRHTGHGREVDGDGWVVATAAAVAAAAAAAAAGRMGVTGGGAFRPTATATTHDRGGYGRPGRDIELVARGGRNEHRFVCSRNESSPPHPTAAAAATDAARFVRSPSTP